MRSEALTITDQPGSATGHRILTLNGPLVLTTMFEFQAKVRADDSQVLIIDFTNVPYADSAGIGALVGAYVTRQHSGRKLALARQQSRARCAESHARRAVLSILRLRQRGRAGLCRLKCAVLSAGTWRKHPEFGGVNAESAFELIVSLVRQSDGSRIADTREPFSLQESRQERSSERAADMVMALGPIQAFMRE
jgi:anti-anti-sigma regulatory factor